MMDHLGRAALADGDVQGVHDQLRAPPWPIRRSPTPGVQHDGEEEGPGPRGDVGAEWYRSRGHAALVLDSFGPRRLTNEVCGDGRVSPFARALDAYDAFRYLATLPFVRRDRVVIQGLSHGGSTMLRALDDVDFGGEALRFAAGIAYFPACPDARPSLYAPAIILTGALDDWTPAAPCQALGERSRGERHPIAVTLYPDAYHTFDFGGPRRINQWGQTLAHNAAATADAERRVDTFLRALARRRGPGDHGAAAGHAPRGDSLRLIRGPLTTTGCP